MKFKVTWNNPKAGSDTREVDASGWRAREDFIEFYTSAASGGSTTVWAVKKDLVVEIEAAQ